MELRSYQKKCLEAMDGAFKRGVTRQLVVMATGLGKTIQVAALHAKQGRPKLFGLMHRTELLKQARSRFLDVSPGLEIGIEKAADTFSPDDQVILASVQTVGRSDRKRLSTIKPDWPSIVWIDETHHAPATSYLNVFDHFGLYGEKPPNRKIMVVGTTATPDRLDKLGYDKIFDDVVFRYGLRDGIKDGWLADIRAWRIKSELDLSEVRTRGGDFVEEDLERAMNTTEHNKSVAEAWRQWCSGKMWSRSLFFCVTKAHARALAGALEKVGARAGVVVDDTPNAERAALIERLKAGTIQALVNVGVFTEGFDLPELDTIHIVRPTKSRGLYCLDARTEILTPDGWSSINDDKPELAASFDIKTGTISWSKVSGKVVREVYPGEKFVVLDSQQIGFRITDQHRMVLRTRTGRRHSKSSWEICTASEMLKYRDAVEIPVSALEIVAPADIHDDEIRFVGWIMTDGTINKHTRGAAITQAEGNQWNDAIDKMLDGCGFKYTRKLLAPRKDSGRFETDRRTILWTISFGQPRCRDRHLRGWGQSRVIDFLDKNFHSNLHKLDGRQLSVLLEAMHLGDGSKQEGQSWTRRSYHIFTRRKRVADQLQSLCVRRGWACNVSVRADGLMCLHAKKKLTRLVATTRSDRSIPKLQRPSPGEQVWCIETGLGTIITRWGGKVSIMGQCQMIGRGTRKAPGKDWMNLIDHTGQAHDICSIGQIFGLPDAWNLEGQSVLSDADELEEAVSDMGISVDGLKSLDDLRGKLKSKARRMQLIKSSLVAADIASSLVWVQPSKATERYIIAWRNETQEQVDRMPMQYQVAWFDVPDQQGLFGVSERLEVWMNELGKYEAKIYRRKGYESTEHPMGTDASLAKLVGRLEGWMRDKRPHKVGFLDKTAKWGTKPASEKQVEVLRKRGIPKDFLEDGALTKREASILMGLPKHRVQALFSP